MLLKYYISYTKLREILLKNKTLKIFDKALKEEDINHFILRLNHYLD